MANISGPPRATAPAQSGTGQTYHGPFAIMTILFFMWGFITVWNDILIPRFKEAFHLSYKQATLVDGAFFGGYGIGALIYLIISMFSGDPINRIGYKNGVIVGLLLTAAGCVLFYPAAVTVSYPLFLLGLGVIGLGLAMVQIAANPYVTILGPERTASSRLNLSQAFNSFGTTLGPIIGGFLVFTYFTSKTAHGAAAVKVPYIGFAIAFFLLAIFFKFAHVPNFTNTEEISRGWGALKHPHTLLGMIATFMYVGGEVTVGSLIINFLAQPQIAGLDHAAASPYVSYYWGGVMIGRFMGAFALSDIRGVVKHIMVVAVPVVAFIVILNLAAIARFLHQDWASEAAVVCSLANSWHYGVLLAVLLVAFFLGESSPHRMLALFSVIIIVLLGVGITTVGETAKWAILGVGLFCSVMWSNIFSLAIEGLGPLKSQASSLLVMAIVGGAVLPYLQGAVADRYNIQVSFIVPMIAFAYIAFYGLYGYRAGRARASISK
jgi:FHS family L-fucose permease-like MFS transporter